MTWPETTLGKSKGDTNVHNSSCSGLSLTRIYLLRYFIRKEKGLVKDPKTGIAPNRKPGMRYTDLGDDLVTKLGRVGQKAGKGWYDYDPKVGKGRKPIPSGRCQALFKVT